MGALNAVCLSKLSVQHFNIYYSHKHEKRTKSAKIRNTLKTKKGLDPVPQILGFFAKKFKKLPQLGMLPFVIQNTLRIQVFSSKINENYFYPGVYHCLGVNQLIRVDGRPPFSFVCVFFSYLLCVFFFFPFVMGKEDKIHKKTISSGVRSPCLLVKKLESKQLN